MNQTPIRLGPMALLLTVISICLTTLSILTFTTSRADLKLAGRYADTIAQRYEIMNEGEAFLADAPENLSQMTPAEDGTYTKEIEKDGLMLSIAIRPDKNAPKGYQRIRFAVTKEWTQDLDPGNLWLGN